MTVKGAGVYGGNVDWAGTAATPSDAITGFEGEWAELSNFWPSPVEWNGEVWPTVEHAYQAGKTLDGYERALIAASSNPGVAKRLGQKVTIRLDWEKVKVDHMRQLLVKKFALPGLRERLLETGERVLIEGNTWGDDFWGMVPAEDGSGWRGSNVLGLLLMQVRAEIRKPTGRHKPGVEPHGVHDVEGPTVQHLLHTHPPEELE